VTGPIVMMACMICSSVRSRRRERHLVLCTIGLGRAGGHCPRAGSVLSPAVTAAGLLVNWLPARLHA
jgi:hypothetical protein